MLTAIACADPRSPLSHGEPDAFSGELAGEIAGLRVGWCADVGGLPVEPPVAALMSRAREQAGAGIPAVGGAARPGHGETVARAIAARSEVFATVASALERFDVIAAPAAQVVPFPVEGRRTGRLHRRWAPGRAPAARAPRWRSALLEHAAGWEAATGLTARHPPSAG